MARYWTTQAGHKKYLKASAFVIYSFAPVFFLGTMIKTAEPARFTMDLLSGFRGVTYAHEDTRFLSALTGGFLLGYGVTIHCLSEWVYDQAPEGVRRSVLAGALSWFGLDSAGSIASGNASNALFNIPVLLAVVGPMWWPAENSKAA